MKVYLNKMKGEEVSYNIEFFATHNGVIVLIF